MKLETWIKCSGEISTFMSGLIILTVSVVLGYFISMYQSVFLGWIFGLGCGISGFLLIILPNLIYIKRMMNDEQPIRKEDSQ